MDQSNTRIKPILFGVLGLLVFTMPFLLSLSEQSQSGKNKPVDHMTVRQSAPELFRGRDLFSDMQIRSMTEMHMNALFQSAQTGDYAALRALGAPDFQRKNSLENLQQIFWGFLKNVDPDQVALFVPKQNRKPYFDKNGMLHIAGHYPTEPQQIHYDLTLQAVNGAWRLFSISVRTVPVS